MLEAVRSRFSAAPLGWMILAVLGGMLCARLPVPVTAGLFGLAALGLLVLIEPVLGIVLMLGVAPLKTLIETESPVAFPVDIGQLGLVLVIGAWMLWRVTTRPHARLPRTPLYLPLIGIMAGLSPSLFAAANTGAWVTEMLKWIEILLLVGIVLDLGREGRWTWIAFGGVLSAVLQALIGIYEFFGGSGAPHLWIANYRYFRAFGTFGQPNPFSAFMGLALPLALGLAWGYALKALACWRNGSDRSMPWARHAVPLQGDWLTSGLLALLYAGFGLILLVGLLVSWGRGAWLGFGAAAGMMVFFAPRHRWQGVLLMVAVGVLPLILWTAGLIPITIQQRVNNAITEFAGFRDVRGAPVGDENFAIVERLAHWQAAYYMANAHPFIGVGLGNYETVYPEYGLPSWPRPLAHAHNDYLNLLAETGLIGLVAYLAGWLTLAWWTVRALRQPDVVMRGLVLGLLGIWTHLAVHSFVDKLYVNNLFLYIGVMLGLLAIAYHQRFEYSSEQ
jgi:O-antigen ligase